MPLFLFAEKVGEVRDDIFSPRKIAPALDFFFFSIYTMVRAKNAHRREIMKLAEQIISLTLAVLMVLTGVPVRAADVSANKMQNAVQEQIEQALEADFEAAGSIYGPTFPTLKQLDEQMTAAVKKMKEKSPSLKEQFETVADKISKLSDKDKEALKKELQTWKNDTDQYVAKNPAALAKYAKSDAEQQTLAARTVVYDRMEQMQVQAGFASEVFSFKGTKLVAIGAGIGLMGCIAGIISSFLIDPIAYHWKWTVVHSIEKGVAASGILLMLIGAGILLSGSATTFFSPEAGRLDCGTVKHRHPCKVINPEKAKAEFLDNPFKAVEFFATHATGEAKVLYLADEEGVNMLTNTINILSYAPIYDVEDPVSQKYIHKISYVNTMHWKKLSKKDKMKYLFELSMQVLVDPDVRTRQ